MNKMLGMAVLAAVLVGCGDPSAPESVAPEPNNPTADAPAETAPVTTTASAAPEIGLLMFDDLDIRGCGMSLWAEGSNPRADGIYLFNGLENPDLEPMENGTLRMRIKGEVMNFVRTEGTGEEFYGQFPTQTFESIAGDTTVTVIVEKTTTGPDAEVVGVAGTITVQQGEQATTVEAVGDAGC